VRIAIYVGELDVKGGTHKQVLRLAQYLLDYGHDVLIVTPNYQPGEGYPEFAKLPILSMPQQTGGTFLSKFKNRFRPIQMAFQMPEFDIINLHDNRVVLFGLIAKLLRRGKRYVWQINDLHPAFQIGAHSAQVRLSPVALLHRLANRLLAQMVDSITVNVSKNRERVKELLSRDASVLYCGVDFPDFDFPIQTGPGAFRLMSTGLFFPYRNYDTLVKACAVANRCLSLPIQLTIVGDTRYSPDYAASIKALADAEGVALTILENLSQSELDQQLLQSHAFAFVNVDQSWGLAVFEAAARKKPVILSKSVGASELLAGKPGFIMVDPLSHIEVADGILALANDQAQLSKSAEQAFGSVEDMSWQVMYCAPASLLFDQLLEI
jgi:glycosyltransferase involved in cell wall biosynthesis